VLGKENQRKDFFKKVSQRCHFYITLEERNPSSQIIYSEE
jgi:hypothetical protein